MGMFVGIILLAVVLGFLTARFVIGPIIGYNADESPVKLEQKDDKSKKTDAEQTEQKASLETGQNQMPEEGYALQFGAFSTKDAAEKLAEALRLKGIETKIVEIDDVFKVISPMLDDKEAALKALQESKDKDVEDVFITSAG
ncbi:MAG: SPOR domain-containing protein [Firmicutes bacterium]|nr:SPOR domain-containing protein [Bacillota bacterium]